MANSANFRYYRRMEKMRYVSSFVDVRGKRRFRFRRGKFFTHYLKTSPGDSGFASEYAACLRASENAPPRKPRDTKRPLVKQVRRATALLPDAPAYVYFVGAPQGPIKIGLATNPDRRLKDIQIGNHMRLELLALMPGTAKEEAELHRKLAAHRLAGEWFERTPAVLEAVKNARSLANAPTEAFG